ncbi:Uncharacterized [Moorella glycerini]|uniref:Uncharacterized protein n=1 Tax=Neomoorella stamsii TaxID=1266720 RepID=A0A9X7J3J1_9FIRM|nr:MULTISPECIES: hypothetical protein [Moorella]PRR72971.1 hypothetical protein MOST_15160 [Moorella stamsii]CEP67642.1 Uncharacterized [Moorella glycerini]
MAKILLGDITLSSWELDASSKALLPVLGRSLGVSFLEDGEGNFILNPPLANKTVVLRPLAGQDQTLKVLLTALSQELQGRGSNVLIVPATASDGRLFRLWQTQVLFAFSQKDGAAPEPALRFFYAPKKREESLGLIAALVQAMLRSGRPLSYTIPGAWEHFKNFRYRRLLNNTEVPSVLIEFCQVHLDQEIIHNITTWLVGGLTWYFEKPLTEETVFKLQSLLQHFRDASLPGLPEGSKSRESKTIPGQGEVLAAESPAITTREPQYRVPATNQEKMETAPPEGEPATMTPAGPGENPVQTGEKRDAGAETTGGAARGETGGKMTESGAKTGPGEGTEAGATTTPQEVAIPGRSAMQVQDGLPVQGKIQGRDGAAGQAKIPHQNELLATEVNQRATATKDSVSSSLASPPAPSGQVRNARQSKGRHRGNPFPPPGDGPVFIFKRPLEASLAPALFTQEVLERMVPLPLQSTFLTGEQWRKYLSSTGANTAMASLAARQAPEQGAVKPPVLNFNQIRIDPIGTGTVAQETGKNDNTLAALKNLSAAILAPEQPGEPLKSEAPSI